MAKHANKPSDDQNDFENFCRASLSGQPHLVIRRLIDDLVTPVAAVLKLGADRSDIFLLESVKGGETRGRYSVIGLKPDQRFKILDGQPSMADGQGTYQPLPSNPIAALREFVEAAEVDVPPQMPPMLSGVFGYVGYDAITWIDDVPLAVGQGLGTPEALLLRPTQMVVFDSVNQEIILSRRIEPVAEKDLQSTWQALKAELDSLQETILGPLQAKPVLQAPKRQETTKRDSNTSIAQFHQMVGKAKQYIVDGDVFQVVLSQRFSMPFTLPPFALYRSLRKSNPSPFLFFLAMDEFSIVGSSPEILVRVRNKKITIRPIAGTRPRGKDEAEDLALEVDLLSDQKERAEHLMLLDLGRNDAGRVAKPGTVKVTKSFVIERYSKVLHIVSNVEAELADDKNALDALFAGFPHGTVSGAPKIRAMQIIAELEQDRRGIYAGAVGYFSAHGDLDTCIALRTAVIKDGKMYVQAGGGNVLDSDEEMERQETLHKSSAVFDAATDAWRFV
ncbi:MAG: anthranilate synthase component I [Robiginitomaculum sp.]|nr:MAG: anthranilate synthase component I [Robiginitomaculum sp.]